MDPNIPHPGINRAASGYTQFPASEHFRDAEIVKNNYMVIENVESNSAVVITLYRIIFLVLFVGVLLFVSFPNVFISVFGS